MHLVVALACSTALVPAATPVPVAAAARASWREGCNDGVVELGEAEGCRTTGTVDLEEADLLLGGSAPGDRCGAALAGGADLDGDGATDLALGCNGEGDGGVVHVIPGRPVEVTGPYGASAARSAAVDRADGARFAAEEPRANLGLALAMGRGGTSLYASAPYAGVEAEAEGEVWELAPSPRVWWGQRAHAQAGRTLLQAGDLDADGGADLLVASWGAGQPGRVDRVGADTPSGPLASVAEALVVGACGRACDADGEPDGDLAGFSLAVGELDGDGVLDIVVGAPGDDAGGPGAGLVYLRHGGDGSLTRLVGAAPGDAAGRAVAVGDVDDDGLDDLLVGAPGADVEGEDDAGVVYLLAGPVAGGSLAGRPALAGAQRGARFGERVAVVGDVDGDGVLDLAVAAPGEDRDEMAVGGGVVWLWYGPVAPDGDGAWARFAGSPGAHTGWALGGVGDLNGDGYADLGVGSPTSESGPAGTAGQVAVVYGRGP